MGKVILFILINLCLPRFFRTFGHRKACSGGTEKESAAGWLPVDALSKDMGNAGRCLSKMALVPEFVGHLFQLGIPRCAETGYQWVFQEFIDG